MRYVMFEVWWNLPFDAYRDATKLSRRIFLKISAIYPADSWFLYRYMQNVHCTNTVTFRLLASHACMECNRIEPAA